MQQKFVRIEKKEEKAKSIFKNSNIKRSENYE